jgi:hypothetical protein
MCLKSDFEFSCGYLIVSQCSLNKNASLIKLDD